MNDAVATRRQRDPTTVVAAIVIGVAVSVIALFAESGLCLSVSAVRLDTYASVTAFSVAADLAVRTILLFCLAERCASVCVPGVAIITLFTSLQNAVTTVRELRNLTRDATTRIQLTVKAS